MEGRRVLRPSAKALRYIASISFGGGLANCRVIILPVATLLFRIDLE